MYHISTISHILRQGVDSLAQWLEHWISTPAIRVRIPSGTWNFFQAMHHLLVTNFHIAITAAGVVPCGGPKKSPRTSSIVQIIFYLGPLRSVNIFSVQNTHV